MTATPSRVGRMRGTGGEGLGVLLQFEASVLWGLWVSKNLWTTCNIFCPLCIFLRRVTQSSQHILWSSVTHLPATPGMNKLRFTAVFHLWDMTQVLKIFLIYIHLEGLNTLTVMTQKQVSEWCPQNGLEAPQEQRWTVLFTAPFQDLETVSCSGKVPHTHFLNNDHLF